VTTATGQYIDVPILGVFKAGHRYQAIVAISIDEVAAGDGFLQFGVVGTDNSSWTPSDNPSWARLPWSGQNVWFLAFVPWTAWMDFTGVSLRWTRGGVYPPSGTVTYRIGYARVVDVTDGSLGIVETTEPEGLSSGLAWLIQPNLGRIGSSIGSYIDFSRQGSVHLESGPLQDSGLDVTDTNISAWAGNSAVGDMSNSGINLEVGPDFTGIEMSEKDGGTIQMYADWDNGAGVSYDIELKDRVAGSHWKMVASDGSAAIPSMGMLPQYAAAPHSGTETEGESYHNTTDHISYTWNGSTWKAWWS
jgi:hypothetical protein